MLGHFLGHLLVTCWHSSSVTLDLGLVAIVQTPRACLCGHHQGALHPPGGHAATSVKGLGPINTKLSSP